METYDSTLDQHIWGRRALPLFLGFKPCWLCVVIGASFSLVKRGFCYVSPIFCFISAISFSSFSNLLSTYCLGLLLALDIIPCCFNLSRGFVLLLQNWFYVVSNLNTNGSYLRRRVLQLRSLLLVAVFQILRV